MKRILLIPGDGIGIEVMAQAQKLLHLLSHKYKLNLITEKVGDQKIPDMAHGREILLGLRFGLDLYINFRPIKLLDSSLSVLKKDVNIDIALFRENTEDIYLGQGRAINHGTENEITIDESKHSFSGVYRIIKAAFIYANTADKYLTLVDKSNAIKFAGNLWQRVFVNVKREFPSVKTNHIYADVAAMTMVQKPDSFQVIVTSNLFGDILSDLGAGLVGGLGLCASANINPGKMALFEPVHGSAPDIAFQNKANPFSMLLSVSLMMEYLGYNNIAVIITKAISNALMNKATTIDIGGSLSCSEAADGIIDFISAW
jgi:3-isopropylmalate dehydrogenase